MSTHSNDLLAPGTRLLACSAHPDDETFFAGLLARAAERSCAVELLCATRGEAGQARDQGDPGRAALGQRRSAELVAACQALGLPSQPRLFDLPDGAVTRAACALAFAPAVATFGPDLIVTLPPDGLYGHPDHLAVTAAVNDVAPPGCRILYPLFPRDWFAGIHARLARVPRLCIAATLPPALDPTRTSYLIELDPALREKKRAAIASHRSQLESGDPDAFLAPGLLGRLLTRESYQLADATSASASSLT